MTSGRVRRLVIVHGRDVCETAQGGHAALDEGIGVVDKRLWLPVTQRRACREITRD